MAQQIGLGCSPARFPPSLAADSPILGTSITVRLRRAGARRSGLLVAGSPSRGFRHSVLGAGCSIYFDLSQPPVVATVQTDAWGNYDATGIQVPNLPVLRGVRVMLQAAIGPSTQAPLGLDLSNGLLLVLGDR